MTQLPVPGPFAGMTPEQMQAMLAFLMQNQAAAMAPATASTPGGAQYTPVTQASGAATAVQDSDGEAGSIDSAAGAVECPPTPVKTPPRRRAAVQPPSTPRQPPNTIPLVSNLPQSATSTPSSKMAQLTLDGRKLSATPPVNGRRRVAVSASARKGPLPTGHDSQLVFEDPSSEEGTDGQAGNADGSRSTNNDADGDESDPFEGFPEIVTAPPPAAPEGDDEDMVTETPKATGARRKRNEPTTPRWMSTRRTRKSSQSSPPAVQRSPKKKARVASPTGSPVPSPTVKKIAAEGGMASPFESPNNETMASDVQALKRLLASVRQGVKIPALAPLLEEAKAANLLDLEAVCIDGEDGEDGEDEDGDLEGFVVADDVVEYDDSVPPLPDDNDDDDDDDDRPLQRKRLHRRKEATDTADDQSSEIEFVPTPNKGKARADPPPPPPLPAPPRPVAGPSGGSSDFNHVEVAWQTAKMTLSAAPGGLHPGSTALDQGLNVCEPLDVAPPAVLFDWLPYLGDKMREIDYGANAKPVPGDCALLLSDYSEDGWTTPPLDIVVAAETHVHVPNLLRALMFRRHGPYINESQVDPDDIEAVEVSAPGAAAKRFKFMIKESRAPAVSITVGIVRYSRLDNPTTGPHPVCYINVTSLEGDFDRKVALQCMKFGQRELSCVSFNNAVRMTTLPVFDRPAGGSNGKSKPSASIRRSKSAGQPSRRGANFELSTNDTVPVLDARSVRLPQDMSTWHTALPPFKGPIPKDAAAIVAHTTNMWVGNRSRSTPSGTTYNVQYNLLYIIIVGELPAGLV